jgi:hypothetical protein
MRQTLLLIAIAVLLGGVALLIHSDGSLLKLLGGAALALAGLASLLDSARASLRARRGLTPQAPGIAMKTILYPILIALAAVAIAAPLVILAKAVLTLMHN